MTYIEALDMISNHSHIQRYRELCLDSYPDHEAYRELVIKIAKGEPLPGKQNRPLQNTEYAVVAGSAGSLIKIPLEKSIKLTTQINKCPHKHNDPPCGCNGSRCRIGKFGKPDFKYGGTLVTFFDCWHCVAPDDEGPLKYVTKV
jgi:hypothetical protein